MAKCTLIGSGVCSDPLARLTHTHKHSQKHTHTLSLSCTRAQNRRGKKNKKKTESRINVGRAHRTAGKAECCLSFSLPLSLFLGLAGRLSSSPRSLPNHRLSLCQRDEKAHLFGNEMPAAQPMRSLPEPRGRVGEGEREREKW